MDHKGRADFERRVQQLSAFEHRGSATALEAQAASYLCEELQAAGINAQQEEFVGSTNNGARLCTHVVWALAGLLTVHWSPWMTLAMVLSAVVSLVMESSTKHVLLSWPFVRSPSRNVTATLPAQDGKAKRRLILCAHYDTQRTGLLWRIAEKGNAGAQLDKVPGFLKAPLFPVMLALACASTAGLLALLGWWGWAFTLTYWLSLAVLGLAAFVLGEWAMGDFITGSNDNATGTAAAMALAEQWQQTPLATDTEIVLLLTGCEESGLLGAAAWADKHQTMLQQTPTYFLNLDTLGNPELRYLGGENTLAGVPVHYTQEMLHIAHQASVACGLQHTDALVIPVQTDGLALIGRGVQGISIFSHGPSGAMPCYHLPTDTVENMSFEKAWEATNFAWTVLTKLATHH